MPPREKPREPRPPCVIEFLRKASEWKTLLQSGTFEDQAHIAKQEGITRARVTEHALRPIARFNTKKQVEAFRDLTGQAPDA